MRGFLSFLLSCLIPRSCAACERGLHALGPAADSGSRAGAPGRMGEFLSTDLSVELAGCVSIPANALCTECWMKLERADAAGALERPEGAMKRVKVIAPFFTNDELLALVRFLKFSGGRTAVPALGWWMARALEDYARSLPGGDAFEPLLVPVPLHSSRERVRGYNQSSLLADEVAGRLGLQVESRAVKRIKNTKSQSTLESTERAANVEDAFRVTRPDLLIDKNIIAIDDLVTTGETALACIAAIERASPASVAVLAAGRVRARSEVVSGAGTKPVTAR